MAKPPAPADPALAPRALRAFAEAALPPAARAGAEGRAEASAARFAELLAAVEAERKADPSLLVLVDKERALPEGFAPRDLVGLDGSGLSLSRPGLRLRAAAMEAMKAMDAAARAEGVTLVVSSTYRTYEYQAGLWERGVKAEGEAATAAVLARPGHSQHQLGTAIDFGSIDDSFAATAAGEWLLANARRFGFSQSYPRGRTEATGYSWESWHYRYTGRAAAALEAEFFDSLQQYCLLFLAAY